MVDRLKTKIEEKIAELISDFKLNPEVFLTEDDVRCHLFQKLCSIPELSNLQPTKDGSDVNSISIHSEIRWLGDEGNLKIRSDIVIIPVNGLRTRNGWIKLPTKGYAFSGPCTVIELKLRRNTDETDRELKKKITDDIAKLVNLKRKISTGIMSYLIVLDKKKISLENVQIPENEVTFSYASSLPTLRIENTK